MRTPLRLRRVLRFPLKLAKVVSLLFCVAAAAVVVVVWRRCDAHPRRAVLARWHDRPNRVECVQYDAGCARGTLTIGWGREVYLGAGIPFARAQAATDGPGWSWSNGEVVIPQHLPSGRGPVRWWSLHYGGVDGTEDRFYLGVPCWLVALVAGAWPLASLVFLTRRRLRRRADAARLCPACGYDLRAMPQGGTAPNAAISPRPD